MKALFAILLLSIFTNAFAHTTDTPLPENQAFQLTATAKDYQTILLQWQIAPNYYLYKNKFKFYVIKPKNVQLAEPLYPAGDITLNTALGDYAVYPQQVIIPVPIINPPQADLLLQVNYQGCSKAGYCYPPTNKVVSINLANNYMQWTQPLNIDVAPIHPVSMQLEKPTDNPITKLLTGKSILAILLGFLGFGVLISFTPCVLPMIPILSSMIIGQKKITHAHAFLLSLFYVLGMAITYAAAGVLFGFLGASIQVIFQKTWVIATFSLLFVAMAFSLFGFYNLQPPERLRHVIANLSNHQKKGTYFGAAIMGCLSTLILSPCVTPPLVAVLGFISQTGNATLGGAALLLMGIGMGFPLLLIGAIGPKVLPKSGPWMNTLKNIMGIFMLAVAVFMAQRILPNIITMFLWAGLCIGTGLYLGALTTVATRPSLVKKTIGLLFFIYGVLLINAAYQGQTNPLDILARQHQKTQPSLHFKMVQSLSMLNQVLKSARPNEPILIDFYADWCIACKELDTLTFSNPAVQDALSPYMLIRADVTENEAEEQTLMKHFDVVAPPTLIFLKNRKAISHSRIIGFVSAPEFLAHIKGLQ